MSSQNATSDYQIRLQSFLTRDLESATVQGARSLGRPLSSSENQASTLSGDRYAFVYDIDSVLQNRSFIHAIFVSNMHQAISLEERRAFPWDEMSVTPRLSLTPTFHGRNEQDDGSVALFSVWNKVAARR